MPPCVNCNRDVSDTRRGLCRRCYSDRGIRGRFAAHRRQWEESRTGPMTYEELTAFVDAQLADPASLPAWWAGEGEKAAELNTTPVPFVLRRNGEMYAVANPR